MANKEKKQFNFRWEGVNKEGIKITGKTTGTNIAMVKVELRQQGITPTRIRKKTSLPFIGGKKRGKRIKSADIANFARQIATMLIAGVALVRALEIIAEGQTNPAMADLVRSIKNSIENGSTLAEALATQPKYFDQLFVNLVSAGENSGALENLLDKIATHKEKTESLKATIRKALFYPSAVVITAFGVMGFMLYFVVPQFESLFSGFGAELPSFTRLVIHMSEVLQQYWWVVIGAIVLAGFAFARLKRHSYKFSYRVDKLLLKMPIVGKVLRQAAVARFSRTLATMFAAGVPITDALTSVAGAAGNLVFEEGIKQIRSQVATGQRMQKAMDNTGLFPNMAQQMIAIGEESSALDDMCNRVADIYEERVDNTVDSLSSLLEPLVMVVIGVLVGGLIVAMYLPIFQMGTAV